MFFHPFFLQKIYLFCKSLEPGHLILESKFFLKMELKMTVEELRDKVENLFDYLQDILHQKTPCVRMSTFVSGNRKER